MNSGWKNILTAPKDGTILFLTDGQRMCRGSWKQDWLTEEVGWFDEHYDDFSTGYSFGPLLPTHWMPLPDFPKEPKSEWID